MGFTWSQGLFGAATNSNLTNLVPIRLIETNLKKKKKKKGKLTHLPQSTLIFWRLSGTDFFNFFFLSSDLQES